MRLLIFMIFLFCLVAIAKAQTKEQIVETIIAEALKTGLDPDLAVAIATVESGLNPKAIGALNEQGLYQLRPEFHSLNGGLDNNIEVGIQYLVHIKNRSPASYGNAWFVSYNYGPNKVLKYPAKTRYYQKVMNVISTIKINRYLIADN